MMHEGCTRHPSVHIVQDKLSVLSFVMDSVVYDICDDTIDIDVLLCSVEKSCHVSVTGVMGPGRKRTVADL